MYYACGKVTAVIVRELGVGRGGGTSPALCLWENNCSSTLSSG